MRGTSPIVAALAAFLTAACAAPPPESGPSKPAPVPAAVAPTSEPEPAVKPAPEPIPPAEAVATEPRETAALPPLPPPEPPALKPAELMGLAQGELTELLGTPSLKRTDPPAALWQYRDTDCILDLFLYEDGSAYRVRHIEFRRRGDTAALAGTDAESCLARLRTGEDRS